MDMTVRILDLTSGSRGVWFDKRCPNAVYVDISPARNPDIAADSRRLPFSNSIFTLVVFDPPHVNSGAHSNTTKCYGHFTAAQIRDIIAGTASEAHRVTTPDALMSFKWNNHDRQIKPILQILEPWWTPLFGNKITQRTKHNSMTVWVMLGKRPHATAAGWT